MQHLHIVGTKYTSVDGDNNEHEVEKSEPPKSQSQMNRINVNKV